MIYLCKNLKKVIKEMIKICDNCIIGLYLDDYNHNITLEELEEEIEIHNKRVDCHIECYGKNILNLKKISMKNYLDNRRSNNLYKYNYCPYCGEKIKWNEIKEKYKKENKYE